MITERFLCAMASPWVTLNDSTTITIDSTQGNLFQVAINGNRTFANPLKPTDGQMLILKIKQGSVLGVITWGSAFRFGSIPGLPTLSITAAKSDYITFIYNATDGFWDNVDFAKGL